MTESVETIARDLGYALTAAGVPTNSRLRIEAINEVKISPWDALSVVWANPEVFGVVATFSIEQETSLKKICETLILPENMFELDLTYDDIKIHPNIVTDEDVPQWSDQKKEVYDNAVSIYKASTPEKNTNITVICEWVDDILETKYYLDGHPKLYYLNEASTIHIEQLTLVNPNKFNMYDEIQNALDQKYYGDV